MREKHLLRLILIAGAAITPLLLSGCSNEGPQALLEDYRDRVANVLEIDVTPSGDINFSTLPKKRSRYRNVEEIRSGLLDSMDFSACDLLPLIVERNSALGKVMQPSSLLSYEVRFFARLQRCHQQINSGELVVEDKITQLIDDLYRTKSNNLDAVIWNGIFTSDEIASQFSHSKAPLPIEGHAGFEQSLRALAYLIAITEQAQSFHQTNTFTIPNEHQRHDEHFFALFSSEYGGQLQATIELLIRNLNQVSSVINRRLDKRPLCFNKRTNNKADILLNVFNRYYAGKVQPYLSTVHRQGEAWFSSMNQLLHFGGKDRPQTMIAYQSDTYSMNAPSSYWNRYQQALTGHTEAWQRVLGQCGLMPSE